MKDVLELSKGNLRARINRATSQLYSLEFGGNEFMWGGGKPEELKTQEEKKGWQNSEIIMFPIVGPAKDNKITVDGKDYPMGQHGIVRHLGFEQCVNSGDVAGYVQEYTEETKVQTHKGVSEFPFSYEMYKSYILDADSILFKLEVKNTSEKNMCYAIGWHPAFRIDDPSSIIRTKSGEVYTIDKIKELSKTGALKLKGVDEVEYVSKLGTVTLRSNFGNIQIWSPEEDLICIEPVSTFASSEYSGELGEKPGYKTLDPSAGDLYWTKIKFSKTKQYDKVVGKRKLNHP